MTKSYSVLKIKENFFSGPIQMVVTALSGIILFLLLFKGLDWLVWSATWSGDAETCRQKSGLCYPFLFHQGRLILFGTYPEEHLWRPQLMCVLFFPIFLFTYWMNYFGQFWRKIIFLSWFGYFAFSSYLLMGGWGLVAVEREQIGGLPLTLMLSLVSMIASYPLGILLALGRRSEYPLISWVSTSFIELIRGVPLVSLLFMSSVMLPLFMPDGVNLDKILRAQMAFIIFTAANMAEVIRGGLQAIPRGQYEAAASLGLSYWKTMGLVVLPQALRLVIPPTVSTSLALFKDTSLVIIISLFDLLSTMKLAQKDLLWAGFDLEAYVFTGFIYFIFCLLISALGKKIERLQKIV